jgi:bifunctional N-acetylglucosamine-1-phosphate-uridyltransferase/glucosamine-1-phosphate-acetyltransferase GlmU-like protein
MLDNPTGYGRIMRKDKQIQAIVEQKDANAEQLTICEVNTGIMALDSGLLKAYLGNLDANNAQPILALSPILVSGRKRANGPIDAPLPMTASSITELGNITTLLPILAFSGSTITKDVPDGQLSLSRAKQAVLKNWHKPVKT